MEDRINRWTFRDIFLSLSLGLDPILLTIGYAALMVGGAAYGLFSFLGEATGEPGARTTFSILGGVLAVTAWVLASGVMARVVAARLLEGRRSSPREVWDYFLRRARALLTIPAAFAAAVLGALGGVGFLEILGRLPGLGPILFGGAFTLVFLLALAAVVAFVLHTLAGLIYPTILAVRSDGTLGTVREVLSLARQKGLVLLIYSLVILAAGAAVTLLLLSLAWAALAIVVSSAQSLMGAEFASVLAGLPSVFRPVVDLLQVGLGPLPAPADVAWHHDLAGLLLGFSLLSIFAAAAAYPAVLVNSAGTITYFILTENPLPGRLPAAGPPETEPQETGAEPPGPQAPGEIERAAGEP
jgi:hypothetical protein